MKDQKDQTNEAEHEILLKREQSNLHLYLHLHLNFHLHALICTFIHYIHVHVS